MSCSCCWTSAGRFAAVQQHHVPVLQVVHPVAGHELGGGWIELACGGVRDRRCCSGGRWPAGSSRRRSWCPGSRDPCPGPASGSRVLCRLRFGRGGRCRARSRVDGRDRCRGTGRRDRVRGSRRQERGAFIRVGAARAGSQRHDIDTARDDQDRDSPNDQDAVALEEARRRAHPTGVRGSPACRSTRRGCR